MNNQFYDGYTCLHIAKQFSKTFNWHDISNSGIHYALKRCANMIPLIYFEAIIFKVCLLFKINLTCAEFISIGTYVNTVMLLTSLYLTYCLIKKYCKPYIATGFTFLILINVPLYATVVYIYTDIPSLLMIMLIITCYSTFLSTNKKNTKILTIIGIIIFSIIGMLFKFNVLIATIAIIIHYLLTHYWKKTILLAIIIIIPTLISVKGINRLMTITSPVPQDAIGLPAINWINMSLVNPKNGFSEAYFDHTFKLKEELKTNKRVSEVETKELFTQILPHPFKMGEAIYNKISVTYGVGVYDFYSYFSPKYAVHNNHHILPKLLYGKYKKIYLYSSFILQLSMFLIMLLGTIKIAIKQKTFFVHTAMIGLFGNMLMLVFWESHARYLLAFIGLILFITCFAMQMIQKEK